MAPSVFGPDGLYGGGERYPLELARALAGQVDCELVTFGPRPATWRADGGLRVRVLRPVTWLHGHPAQPVAPLLPAALTRALEFYTATVWGTLALLRPGDPRLRQVDDLLTEEPDAPGVRAEHAGHDVQQRDDEQQGAEAAADQIVALQRDA